MRKSPCVTLTRERLRVLAGDRAFERGERYARDGRVGDVAEDGGHVTAWVAGTERYRSDLRVVGSTLTCACTCPVGADGACCKHCVAVGLQWIEAQSRTTAEPNRESKSMAVRATRSSASRPRTMKDVRTYLATLPADMLIELEGKR